MNKYLFIIRGLPGSGKTTLARELAPDANAANDDYFTAPDGTYNYDLDKFPEARRACIQKILNFLQSGVSKIAVHNVFSVPKSFRIYEDMARQHGYTPVIVKCTGKFGDVHAVPKDVLQDMALRWKD